MMNIPGIQGGTYTAVFEADENGNLHSPNGSVPGWLRDMIERAYASSGLRTHRKVASSEAIASLEQVSADILRDPTCPICYERYDFGPNKKQRTETPKNEEAPSALDRMTASIPGADRFIELESSKLRYRDPALFLPVDGGAAVTYRFPQHKLVTKEEVTNEEMFPTLNDLQKTKKPEDNRHLAMRMPNCHHVFGKPCIIEWLRENVSCPLCRKEVESIRDSDPLRKKCEVLERNCNFIFGADKDMVMKHLLLRSTNVFEPFRKPYNPAVTPLTDTTVPQQWATPSMPEGVVPNVTESPDPPLIIPRKFPLSSFQSVPRPRTFFGRRPVNQESRD